MNQFLRLFSWSKVIFKIQIYGHYSDSSSISLFFSSSSVSTGYNTYHFMRSYIPSCLQYGDGRSYIVCCKPFPVLHRHMLWHRWMHWVLLVHGRYQVQEFHPSYSSRTNTDPVEAAFTGLLLSWGLQHKGSQDMHKKRFWLVGCRVIILNDFPLLHIYKCLLGRGCQITHSQKTVQLPRDQHELHQYHQSVQIWYIQFALQLLYHIRANEMHV